MTVIFDDLRRVLAAAEDQIELGPKTPGLAGASEYWADVLNTETLAFSSASASGLDGGAGPIVVRGTVDVLGSPAGATAILFPSPASGEHVEVLVFWHERLPVFKPADFFLYPPSADVVYTPSQNLLNGVVLGSPVLAFSTFDFVTTPSALDAIGTLPDWLRTVPLPAGLTLAGELSLPKDVQSLLLPLAPTLRTPLVAAVVDVVTDDLWLTCTHTLTDDVRSLAPFGTSGPSATLESLVFACPIDGWADSHAHARIAARLSDNGAAMTLTLDVDLLDGSVILKATAVTGQEPTLGWLASQLDLTGGAPTLPFDLGNILLASLEGRFDPQAKRLTDCQAVFTTTKPISLVDGHVQVTPEVVISHVTGSGGYTEVEIVGLWQFGDSRMETIIDIATGEVFASLEEGGRFDVNAFIDGALPSIIHGDLTVVDLDLYGNFRTKTAELELETAGALSFTIEQQEFSLEDLSLYLRYESGFTARAQATLEMFGATLTTRVSFEDKITRLDFALSRLSLSDLAEVFLKDIGHPTDLGTLDLADIGVTVERPSGNFRLGARLGAPIHIAGSKTWEIKEARLEASREGKTLSATLAGTLTLGGIDVALEADLAAGELCYKGETKTELNVDAILADVAHHLELAASSLPSLPADVKVTRLAVEYRPAAKAFKLAFSGTATVHGKSLAVEFVVDVFPSASKVTGSLTIGKQTFALDAATGAQKHLTASWSGSTTLSGLAMDLGLDPGQLTLPSDLDPTLTAAKLNWDGKAVVVDVTAEDLGEGVIASVADTAGHVYVMGLAIAKDVDLTNLPEIGSVLPHGEGLVVKNLHLLWHGAASAEAAKTINATLPAGFPRLAEAQSAGSIAIVAEVDAAGTAHVLALPVPAATPPAKAGDKTAPTPGAGMSKWFSIGRRFGPVSVERLGLSYRASVLSLMLDANLKVAGFEVGLEGLSVGSKLTRFSPQVSLDGLELAINEGPLSLAGFFARENRTPPDFAYDGGFVLKISKFGLTGVGSYARVSGHTSMFLFAEARLPLGGPPYLYLTGLLGGFGYNSDLRLPEPDTVHEFPLIAGFSQPGALGGNPDPMAVLGTLLRGDKPWITVRAGENWAAAGVEFTSFELVDTNALIVVEFGAELKLRLIGLATAQLPKGVARPFAFVQLQMEAGIDLTEGSAFATAILSPNSFVLDPSCHLTGGFAVKVWWQGEHEGDFVLTLGGYHPSYRPPARYPQVPRLGLLWQVSDAVTISGSAYFALTPSAVMGGGALAVVFHKGSLKAWLTAHADLLIEWRPFHFEASMGISVGVSCRLHLLFVTATITLEVGADLALWGPPVGGEATIHCWVISFTVGFGKDRVLPPACDTWADFAPMLPASDKILVTSAVSGLQAGSKDDIWRVRGDLFAFTTETAIPASALLVHAPSGEVSHGQGGLLHIRPMAKGEVTSEHVLSITRRVDSSDELVDLAAENWSVQNRSRNVSAKLWSRDTKDGTPPPDDPNVKGRLVGLEVAPPRPRLGASTGAVSEESLAYEDIADPASVPIISNETPQPAVSANATWTTAIATAIASDAAAKRRGAILASLAAAGMALAESNDPMTAYGADLTTTLRAPPLMAA